MWTLLNCSWLDHGYACLNQNARRVSQTLEGLHFDYEAATEDENASHHEQPE